jgi:hypothetical protein
MRYIKYILLAALAILLANTVYADNKHHSVVIQQGEETIITTNSQAMALAVSEINPTLLSSKWQMGVGFGEHNDNTAMAIGLAKRVNKNLLFSGKIANQGGDIGTSMGLNFKF